MSSKPDQDEPVTREELLARLEALREEAASQEDLAEFRAAHERRMAALVQEALPVIVQDVAERLAGGDPFTPAAARAPTVVRTDYSPVIGEAFAAADVDGGPGAG